MKKSLAKFYLLSSVAAVVLAASMVEPASAVGVNQKSLEWVTNNPHLFVGNLEQEDKAVILKYINVYEKMAPYTPVVKSYGSYLRFKVMERVPYEVFRTALGENLEWSQWIEKFDLRMETSQVDLMNRFKNELGLALAGKYTWIGHTAQFSGLTPFDWSSLDAIFMKDAQSIGVASWAYRNRMSWAAHQAFQNAGISMDDMLNDVVARARVKSALLRAW